MPALLKGEKILACAKTLIDLSLEAQQVNDFAMKSISRAAWIKEYCTVRVGTARGAGHTYALAGLVAHLSQYGAVALTASTRHMASGVLRELPESVRPEVVSEPRPLRGLMEDIYRVVPRRYSAILVDCAGYLSLAAKEDILKAAIWALRPDEPFHLVFMG